MDKKLFRFLRADEIECRAEANEDGLYEILLYKTARCDQDILDETVGAMNWKNHYSEDKTLCTVSIFDNEKKEWISKQNAGTLGTYGSRTDREKALASDAFKRACFNWGIGRELYSAPYILLPPPKVPVFYFRCTDIEYDGSGRISSVGIGTYDLSTCACIDKKVFTGSTPKPVCVQKPAVYRENQPAAAGHVQNPVSETGRTETKSRNGIKEQETQSSAPVQGSSRAAADFADDEIILIGNCRGKSYGECKGTERFDSFLKWVRDANGNYPDPERMKQFERLKLLASVSV